MEFSGREFEISATRQRKHAPGQSQNQVHVRSGAASDQCRPRGGGAERGRSPMPPSINGQETESALFTSGRCCAKNGQRNQRNRRSRFPGKRCRTNGARDSRSETLLQLLR